MGGVWCVRGIFWLVARLLTCEEKTAAWSSSNWNSDLSARLHMSKIFVGRSCGRCRLFIALKCLCLYTWSDNKVHELIAVKLLHISLLNTTVVAFKLLPLGSYAPIRAPITPFKTILELVLWNGLQICRCITPDVINVIKCIPFNISFIFGNRKKVTGARSGE